MSACCVLHQGLTPLTSTYTHANKTIQAQSAIIPAFDAFLGVVHEMDEMREYLLEMRRYMPRPHVAFIERLEGMRPSVREQALRAAAEAGVDGELVAAYDEAMGMLAQFRCVFCQKRKGKVLGRVC